MAKTTARERLLARIAEHAWQGNLPKPRVRIVAPATAKTKAKLRITTPGVGRELGELKSIRQAEQQKRRAELIAKLTGHPRNIRKKPSGLFDLFGRLRTAAQNLLKRKTPVHAHKRLGAAALYAPTPGMVRSQGLDRSTASAIVVDRTPIKKQPMQRVTSSNVYSVGWEQDETSDHWGIMYIQFRNGWLYAYHNAPRWLYDGLMNAGSKGRYVWAYIRRGLFPDGTPYGSASVEGYERIDSAGRPFGYTGKRKQIAALHGYRRK